MRFLLTILISSICLVATAQSDTEVQTLLRQVSEKVNEQCPMRLTEDVEMMSTTVFLKGRRLRYNHRYIALSASDIQWTDELADEYEEKLLNFISSEPAMELFGELGVTISYALYSSDMKVLDEWQFPPSSYYRR